MQLPPRACHKRSQVKCCNWNPVTWQPKSAPWPRVSTLNVAAAAAADNDDAGRNNSSSNSSRRIDLLSICWRDWQAVLTCVHLLAMDTKKPL